LKIIISMFYETPQFIREEVKFFGIITFTQLGILITIGAIVFFFLYSPIPKFLSFIFIAIIIPIGLYITFGELGGIKVYRLIPDIIRHFFLPKHYLFKKENIPTYYQPPKAQESKTIIQTEKPIKKTLDPDTIKKLSQLLDQ